MTIEPTPEQFRRLATSDSDEPVVMINLLRFKPRAEGIDAEEGITGHRAAALADSRLIACTSISV